MVLAAALAAAGLRLRGPDVPPAAWAAPDVSSLDATIAFFERRLSRDPADFPAAQRIVGRRLQRFQLAADPADVARAESLARGLVGVDPDPAAAWGRLSGVLLARHAFPEGLAAAERAVEADGGTTASWGVLYDAAFAAGDYARAEEALTRLPAGSISRDVRAAFWLAARGRSESARSLLAGSCRRIARWSRPPAEAWCWTELARMEAADGDVRAAVALERRALALVPGYRAGVEGLADLALAREDWEEARALYRVIATDAHPDLYLRLAEAETSLGNDGASHAWEREFLRAAAAPGAEPLYGRELALYWAEREGGADRALGYALRDVARRPTVESWDVLAWVRFRRGELEDALAASDRAFAWGAPTEVMEARRAGILAALQR